MWEGDRPLCLPLFVLFLLGNFGFCSICSIVGTGLQIDMSSEVRLMIPLRLLQHTPDGIDALPCSASPCGKAVLKRLAFVARGIASFTSETIRSQVTFAFYLHSALCLILESKLSIFFFNASKSHSHAEYPFPSDDFTQLARRPSKRTKR